MANFDITGDEVAHEMQSIDPQLVELAVKTILNRKQAEYIEMLEARLAATEMGDDDDTDGVPSVDQPEQED